VEKSDVLTLPPTMREVRTCELSPAAAKVYARLDREFTVKVQSGEITAGNARVKLLRLTQLAGGYARFDDGTRQVMDANKIDTAVDILKDPPPTEPVIIFAPKSTMTEISSRSN
jgi:hypothetical protein